MKIVMLGAGALGSTIGGTLAMGGNDVHFVDMVAGVSVDHESAKYGRI